MKFTNLRACIALLLLVLPFSSVAAAAATATFSTLSLPVTPGTNGTAFFTVTSSIDDTLVSASSDCCTAVEFHRQKMQDGIMRMRRVESVTLKAGVPTVFAPGGLHVMLIGLKKPLAAGDTLDVLFHFAHAPAQHVLFTADALSLHPSQDSPKHF